MRDKSGVNVKRILFSVAIVLLALGTVQPVAAAAITGVLNIQGSVLVSQTTIDWYLPVLGGYGEISTKDPDSGYFEEIVGPLSSPAIAQELDLDAVGGPIVPPLPGGAPLPNFLSNFTNTPSPEYSDLSFTLESIIIPNVAECVDGMDYVEGQTCRFGVFLLTQGQTGVTVKLEVFGSFVDLSYGDNGSLNDATGLYSTTLNQPQWNTIREVVDFINGGGTIDTGYTAEFTANAVPEPATLLTFGLGTAALAAHRRRRAKKSTKA